MPKLIATNIPLEHNRAAKYYGQPSSSSHKSMLSWDNIRFVVGEAVILDSVSGSVPSGGVTAILGPSGAGKSSLLNVLAGRSATRGSTRVTGRVECDGAVVDPVAFRRNIAYVMQDDALVPTETPREAIYFSASLRTGADEEHKQRLVTDMLAELNLTGCADVMIGGGMIKGISGGQRKRTSIGVELVTRPRLVFLDEPTSGLDSESALTCVKLLKSIAGEEISPASLS